MKYFLYIKKIILFFLKYIFALGSTVYLFTFGLIFANNRDLIYKICQHFGYIPGRIKPVIPQEVIFDIAEECTPVCLGGIFNKGNAMSCFEEACIIFFLKRVKAKRIFEIGTFNGLTALNMALNAPDDAIVYSLDLPQAMMNEAKLSFELGDKDFIKKSQSGSVFSGKPCAHKIVQLYGDSAQYDFSQFYGTMDMVFVDASHSYEYVKNDSLIALRLLCPQKGVIVWHDYGGGWNGVTRALNELYANNPDFKNIKHLSGSSFAYLIRG